MASNFPAFIAHGEPHYPLVREVPVNAGATFVAQELVAWTSPDIAGCGADPANILGLALAPASAKTLYYENISGLGNKVPVAILNSDTVVGMASATTPAQANLYVAYGVEKTGNNWRVDTTDVVNTRLIIVGIDIANGIWYVKFLPANLQGDGVLS